MPANCKSEKQTLITANTSSLDSSLVNMESDREIIKYDLLVYFEMKLFLFSNYWLLSDCGKKCFCKQAFAIDLNKVQLAKKTKICLTET